MQIPSNMLITRIRPGIYMSSWMLVWAVVSGTFSSHFKTWAEDLVANS
jgi:hypothetical protein